MHRDAVCVHVEAIGYGTTHENAFRDRLVLDMERMHAVIELVRGGPAAGSVLHQYLTANGTTEQELEWFRDNAVEIDVVGVNYYPFMSLWHRWTDGGRVRQEGVWGGGIGLATVIRNYHERYRRPIFIGECSFNERAVPGSGFGEPPYPPGRPEGYGRTLWLDEAVETVRALRSDGVPVIGFCWWPLYDLVNWEYREGQAPVEQYLEPMGLYALRRAPDGTLRANAFPWPTGWPRSSRRGSERDAGTIGLLARPAGQSRGGRVPGANGRATGRCVGRPRTCEPHRRAHGLQRWLRPPDRDRPARRRGDRHAGRRWAAHVVAPAAGGPRDVPARPRALGLRGWGAYPAGVAWALRREGVDVPGFELIVDGSVPVASGLSSSAALECAVAAGLVELAGAALDGPAVALVAQRAEVEAVGMPCGVMDQMASVLCRAGHALHLDTRSLAFDNVPFEPGARGLALVVLDTRAPRRLVEAAYAERRADCAAAAARIGVPSLRDASIDRLEAASLDPRSYRRARHVLTENARVQAFVEHLRTDDWNALGGLLTSSHASLRDDFEVSSPELDEAVAAALDAGALGARMTGAGFGGCAIALAPVGAADDVVAHVVEAFERHDLGSPVAFTVIPVDGARRIA